VSGLQPAAQPPRIWGALVGVVSSHLRVTMYREGYALVLSSGVASVLGLVFWAVAARRYAPGVLGVNSAVISTMQLLGGLAQLNLASAMVRFVPSTGRATRRFIGAVYLVSLAGALVASLVFLAGVDIWTPALDFLRGTPILALVFTVSTMGWAIFNLQHFALTGLRRAILVPVENSIYSAGKLVLLIVLAGALPVWGIYTSWTAALALTLLPTTALIFGWLAPRHDRRAAGGELRPRWKQVVRYSAADYAGGMCWLALISLVPIIVLQEGGAAANAYFALDWVLVTPLYLVSASMGYSLVASSVAERGNLRLNTYRMLTQTSVIVVGLASVLFVAAPWVLHVFGDSYTNQGTSLLRLLVLATIPGMINTLYVNVARVRRTMRVVVAIMGIQSVLVLALTWSFFKLFGLLGVGMAWILGQSLVAAAVAARAAWEFRSEASRPESAASDDRAARRRTFRARGLQLVSSTMRHLRLLDLLRRCRSYWRHRRRVREVERLVPEVLRTISLADGLRPASWTVRTVFGSVSDTTVVVVGPASDRPVAALKIPHTQAGSASLVREAQTLREIGVDIGQGSWRRFLPGVMDHGWAGGQPYLLEELLPGVDSRRLARDPATRSRVLLAVAEAIRALHHQTATRKVLDGATVERWVGEPISALRGLDGGRAIAAHWSMALDRLALEVYDALLGRMESLSWIHGDLCLANILVSPDGTEVTGFVDWELAARDQLPVLDLLHLLLSTRALAQGREQGAVILEFLRHPTWSDLEETVLESARCTALGDLRRLRATVVLCWLRHVASNLTKSDDYARNRLWFEANVADVLRGLS
jgi:O-antigen/teichoic acid export membrane protein/aminoglycoside phosphotransferase